MLNTAWMWPYGFIYYIFNEMTFKPVIGIVCRYCDGTFSMDWSPHTFIFLFFFLNLKPSNASIGTRKRSLQLGCMKRVVWLAVEEGRGRFRNVLGAGVCVVSIFMIDIRHHLYNILVTWVLIAGGGERTWFSQNAGHMVSLLKWTGEPTSIKDLNFWLINWENADPFFKGRRQEILLAYSWENLSCAAKHTLLWARVAADHWMGDMTSRRVVGCHLSAH